MIIEIEGSKQTIKRALNILNELPKNFRPLYFSDTEGVIDKKNNLCSDLERFNQFVKNNPLGFIFYSRCCHIDVSFSDIGHSSLFIDVTRKEAFKNSSEVLKILAKSHPIFGYAGMWGERKSRNGTFKDFGSSTLEWWVGRDVDKYVPGIYWLTLLSKEMLEHLKIEPNTFSNVSFKVENIEDNNFYFIQAYNKVEDWKENEELIDGFCATTKGFFSKKNIQEKLDNINDRNEYDAFMSKWS